MFKKCTASRDERGSCRSELVRETSNLTHRLANKLAPTETRFTSDKYALPPKAFQFEWSSHG